MRDYMEIGSTPAEEACAQVGAGDYSRQAHIECRAFINQIIRVCGVPPEGASLVIKANPHDYGTYYEVACRYNDDNETAEAYAYKCEAEAPLRWDDEARQELERAGYTVEAESE